MNPKKWRVRKIPAPHIVPCDLWAIIPPEGVAESIGYTPSWRAAFDHAYEIAAREQNPMQIAIYNEAGKLIQHYRWGQVKLEGVEVDHHTGVQKARFTISESREEL